jgi:hypothetical protein
MVARLLRREVAGVHLFLDVRVILGDLLQRAVAQKVHARVADLPDQILPITEHEHRRGRPHSLLVHFRDRALVDRAIRGLERRRDSLTDTGIRQAGRPQLARKNLNRHLARDFTSRMTAHSVGDDEQATLRVGEKIILISRPDHPDVGTGPYFQLH